MNCVPFWATAMLWFLGPVGVAEIELVVVDVAGRAVVVIEVVADVSAAGAGGAVLVIAAGVEDVLSVDGPLTDGAAAP